MEQLNQSLFLLLDAGQNASGMAVFTATLLADGLIWIVPVGLVIGWLWGASATRRVLIAATVSGLVGLLVNQVIGLVWYHPRPFEVGIGQTLITHVRDSSFPSDHLTLIWATAFSLSWREQFRIVGWVLVSLGFPMAWARIYLGVHFPLDILGAAFVALCSAGLIMGQERWLIPPLMRLLLPPYRTICAGLIRRGWVRE